MRNLSLLFKTQDGLDNHITNAKGLTSSELIHERILAFQVELGELTNEWRKFKFWSTNQKPRTSEICGVCDDKGIVTATTAYHDTNNSNTVVIVCPACHGVPSDKNPFLEEYVDCLHFILSIGNTLGFQDITVDADYTNVNTIKTFIEINGESAKLSAIVDTINDRQYIKDTYEILFNMFVGLGEQHLDFTWSQIEEAYFSKNKINHLRQKNGY